MIQGRKKRERENTTTEDEENSYISGCFESRKEGRSLSAAASLADKTRRL